eukprot:gene49680-45352_t
MHSCFVCKLSGRVYRATAYARDDVLVVPKPAGARLGAHTA